MILGSLAFKIIKSLCIDPFVLYYCSILSDSCVEVMEIMHIRPAWSIGEEKPGWYKIHEIIGYIPSKPHGYLCGQRPWFLHGDLCKDKYTQQASGCTVIGKKIHWAVVSSSGDCNRPREGMFSSGHRCAEDMDIPAVMLAGDELLPLSSEMHRCPDPRLAWLVGQFNRLWICLPPPIDQHTVNTLTVQPYVTHRVNNTLESVIMIPMSHRLGCWISKETVSNAAPHSINGLLRGSRKATVMTGCPRSARRMIRVSCVPLIGHWETMNGALYRLLSV